MAGAEDVFSNGVSHFNGLSRMIGSSEPRGAGASVCLEDGTAAGLRGIGAAPLPVYDFELDAELSPKLGRCLAVSIV